MMPGKESSPTRFGLIRHGETVWNRDKRIQGRLDSPLTPEGRAACRKWGALLASHSFQWHSLIASPLQRTLDTAAVLNTYLQLPLYIDEDLREQNWGEWEGMTLQQLRSAHQRDLEEQIGRGWDFRPPHGESRKEVLLRVKKALTRQADRQPGKNLLIVTHLGVIKSLTYSVEGRDYLPQEPKMPTSRDLKIFQYAEGTFSIQETTIPLP